MIFHGTNWATVSVGDCIDSMRTMPAGMFQMCVTSPPYFGLRDYGHAGQIGLEPTPAEFVAKLVEVFREVRRVLRDDGTLWLNLGDSYAGSWGAQGHKTTTGVSGGQIANHPKRASNTGTIREAGLKPKDLIGIPWRVAFALQQDGWYLRQDIIWHKPNPMPESVTDRCTKSHEYVFLLAKSEQYFCDMTAVKEPAVGGLPGNKKPLKGVDDDPEKHRTRAGLHAYAERQRDAPNETRNRRSVWSIATRPYAAAHFATYPPQLVEPCILAGSKPGDLVLDPFGGSGTSAGVALRHGRNAMLCELNADYAALAPERVRSICDAA